MAEENNENIETPSELKKANWFNRPTTLSKILTMILFIVLPFVAFYLGVNYQKMITENICLTQMKENSLITNPTPIPTVTINPTSIPTVTINPTIIPSPTIEISKWKTYTNKDYGFSFKYPPQFTIKETPEKFSYDDRPNEQINRYYLSFSTQDSFSGFSVDVNPTNGMTIGEYYKGLTENGDPWIREYVTPYGNAIEAAQITCYSCSNTTMRFGKYFYSFLPFQDGTGIEYIWNYMDQIKPTFKFTR